MKRPSNKIQAKSPAPNLQKSDEPARKPLSRGRLWLFRLTALALPFALLLVLELGLRITSQGYPTSFFKSERGDDGKDYLLNNDRFTLRFFPPELARWPGTFKLLAKKPADVQRDRKSVV